VGTKNGRWQGFSGVSRIPAGCHGCLGYHGDQIGRRLAGYLGPDVLAVGMGKQDTYHMNIEENSMEQAVAIAGKHLG
jgi:hypothetical protein